MSGETKFQMWVAEYGAKKLADELTRQGVRVTVRAVYEWLRGEYEPRGKKFRAIVELAGDRLTHDDLAQHFERFADAKRVT